MKLDELKKAIAVQKKAYGLLLWLKERARSNPAFLSSMTGEPFASGESCGEWVHQRIASFPGMLRPEAGEIRPCGFVRSSFFGTSFRVAETRAWHQVETTLVAGAIPYRGRKRQRVEQHCEDNAVEMRRLALHALAIENRLEFTADMFDQALSHPDVLSAMTLWSYGCELVRRCQYASQGPAVHHLWLALDLKIRKNLSADVVWNARGQLVKWLAENQTK